MRTVSMQGLQLSPGQRRQLEQQRQLRAFMNPVLQDSVNETIKKLDERKEQGAKPEKVWTICHQECWRATISIAEWMGF